MEGLAWADIVKIAAGSGVVAAGITQFFQWLKDRSKLKSEARYRAIQLIAKLDEFAIICSNRVEWHEQASQNSEYFDKFEFCELPKIFWADDKLEVFDATISSRVAWVSTEISLANFKASANFEDRFDRTEYAADRISVVGYFGYKALILADLLRSTYSLPQLVSEWSLKGRKKFLKHYWLRAQKDLK